MTPAEAILPINPSQPGSGYSISDAWDSCHNNSVGNGPEGTYLISARDACSVHKINITESSIIWRLVGSNNSSDLRDAVDCGFQHHARWPSQGWGSEGVSSLYGNSVHGTKHDGGSTVHTAPTSSWQDHPRRREHLGGGARVGLLLPA